MAKVGVKPGPKTGIPLKLGGVPGTIVSEPDGVIWGERKPPKESPYDKPLQELLAKTETWQRTKNGPRPVLLFGDLRARASLIIRSKKLKMRVVYAITPEGLFVRYEGRVDENVMLTRRESIKRLLASTKQALSHIQITNELRRAGDLTAEASGIELILTQMLRGAEVVKQEGGLWKLKM